jgi:hypothetical protein
MARTTDPEYNSLQRTADANSLAKTIPINRWETRPKLRSVRTTQMNYNVGESFFGKADLDLAPTRLETEGSENK